jgi:hypothetical protein
MNDLVRSFIFLSGIAAGAACGFLSAGSDDSGSIAPPAAVKAVPPKAPEYRVSTLRSTGLAVKPAARLENVMADFSARAASASRGSAEALLMQFVDNAGSWQLPALIHIAAEHDPQGCYRALLRLEKLNRANSPSWQALFHRWMPADPEAALAALLDLPDRNRRRDAGETALTALKEVSEERFVSLLTEHGTEIRAAGIQRLDWPGNIPGIPSGQRHVRHESRIKENEAMKALDYGSPEARALAERSASGTLSPYDYGRALGYDDLDSEDYAWLAAQPHLAAQRALLHGASKLWEHQDLLTDPNLRAAVIRRIAVERAKERDLLHPLEDFVKTLTPDERAIAFEAVQMDTSLPPDRQAEVLRDLAAAGEQ